MHSNGSFSVADLDAAILLQHVAVAQASVITIASLTLSEDHTTIQLKAISYCTYSTMRCKLVLRNFKLDWATVSFIAEHMEGGQLLGLIVSRNSPRS